MAYNQDRTNYTIVREIANGGQGEVTLIRDIAGELQIQKIMRGSSHTQCAAQEIRINRNLTKERPSPRIPKFLGAHTHSSESYLYFEFCNGGDLHGLIKRYRDHDCRIPEAFIWHIFSHLTEALAYLHYGIGSKAKLWAPILHRDIKPENVFLHWPKGSYRMTTYPNIYLGDYGLATTSRDKDFLKPYHFGSYAWQPPERPSATAKGDVWALGAVIHAMALEGSPPLKAMPVDYLGGKDAWEQAALARFPKTIDHHYSQHLQAWMLQCLAWRADSRPSSANLLDNMSSDAKRIRNASFEPLRPWAVEEPYV